LWQPGLDRTLATTRFIGTPLATIGALILLVIGLAAGLSIGFATWG
jgi:hypothetical protein